MAQDYNPRYQRGEDRRSQVQGQHKLSSLSKATLGSLSELCLTILFLKGTGTGNALQW